MNKTILRFLSAGAAALALALAGTAYGQGVTTASLSGSVKDTSGAPIAGAKVSAIHVPSGTQSTAVTRSNGEYNLEGLRPGGPYSVTVTSAAGTKTNDGVYLDVGALARSNFSFESAVVTMEAVKVNTTSDDTTFDSGAMAFGLVMSSKDISQVATVRRDVQDIENLDPRATVMQVGPADTQYTISFAGQNPRENLFLIDGVSATDNFGLNSNGYAGFRNPLPPEWIESLSVDLSPYDIIYSGFSGGVLNTTLKSGTNDFHGSVYALYQGTNFRGPDPVLNTVFGQHERIQAHTTGATVGGPIIKNKLFFFLGYEAFRELTVPPVQNFIPDNSGGAYDQIIAQANKLGFNPGSLSASNHLWQQNFVGKIDWNINDDHRFEFTFRHTAGEAPNFYNYTSSFETSLSSSWYNTFRTDQSYTAKLNSDWSKFIPSLHTEIEGTYKRYNGTAKLNGGDFPAVTINGVPGSSISGGTAPYALFLGQYWAYQDNNIYTWEQEEHAYADYSIGAHTFKFGVQLDRTAYTDTFIPNILGSYTFDSVQEWLNATPTFIQQEAPYPGYTLGSDVSHYYLMDVSPLIEDTWRPTSDLTIIGGVRMDYPYEPQKPIFSPLFANTYGYSNSSTMNGNETISPRIGFNYDLGKVLHTEKRTQLRGGAGLFLGQNPVVWVENSFNNAGQLNTVSTGNTSSSATTPVVPGYTFTGANPTSLIGTVPPSTAVPTFDVTDKNFHWPAAWKENLALDRELGFMDLILTANVDFSQVKQDAITRDINLKLATSGPAFMPDGAIHYNGNVTPGNLGAGNTPGFTYTSVSSVASATLENNPLTGPVYLLTNTNKGSAQEYTLQLHRPLKDGWAFSIGYTHTHATAVDPSPSSVASSNYGDNPFVNPNDNVAYRSQYYSPDKFVVTATKQFKFFSQKNTTTTLSAQFIAQTGQAYSMVFKGDATGAGLTGEDLFYVPTGPNDPKVTWALPSEQTAFFQFLANTPELAKYAGGIAPRNAFYAPWQHFLSVHLEQQIPVASKGRLVVYWDCFDFGNLLNDKWGTVTNFNNSFDTRTIAGTFLNTATNQYIYNFNASTLGTPTEYSDMSRWSMQVGARFEF